MKDDDLSEEQERRMAAKLMMGAAKPSVVVEVRKRRSKARPEPATLRFIHHFDSYDKEWLWCEVEQKGDKGWIKLEAYDDQKKALEAADKYERTGDIVERLQREV